MSILITGFSPFFEVPHNPSAAVLELLPSRIAGHEVRTAVLPVDTWLLPDALRGLLDDPPRAVIHCGVAVDRPQISIERLAVNVLDFDRPDNAGRRLRDEPILPDAALALPSRLPIRAVLEAWKTAGLDAVLSNSAGTYLCNQAMYLSLHALPAHVPSGFIHLPPDETLALLGAAMVGHLPLARQAEALILAAETTLAALEP